MSGKDLDKRSHPTGITRWRRLRFRQERFSLKNIWGLILGKLYKPNKLDLDFALIDRSLIQSFNFFDATGCSGKDRRTGTKISILVNFPDTPFNIVFTERKAMTHPMQHLPLPRAQLTSLKQFQLTRYVTQKPGVFLTGVGTRSNIPLETLETEKPFPVTWQRPLRKNEIQDRKNQYLNQIIQKTALQV